MKRLFNCLLLGLFLTALAGLAVPGPAYAADEVILKVPVMLVNLPKEMMVNNILILCGELDDQNGHYIPYANKTAEIKPDNGNYSGIVTLKISLPDRRVAKSYRVYLLYAGTCFSPELAKANVGKYMDESKSVVVVQGNMP